MRKAALLILAAIVTPAWTAVAEFDIQEKAAIRKTWTISVPADQTEVKIDNIDGSIDVGGYNGRDVEIVAEQTIQAESNDKLQRAKQEVRLLLDQKGNSIERTWMLPGGVKTESTTGAGDITVIRFPTIFGSRFPQRLACICEILTVVGSRS